MPADRVARRLTAILAADIAGYSRLAEDEEGALAQPKAHRRALIDPLITEHRRAGAISFDLISNGAEHAQLQ